MKSIYIITFFLALSTTLGTAQVTNSAGKSQNGNILVSGKATLIKYSDSKFAVKMSNGEEKVLYTGDDSYKQKQVPGILSVLFNDCNSIRDEINKDQTFTESKLINLTNLYNQCTYGAYQATTSEIEEANRYQTDTFQFYGGIGASVNRISFFNFDDYETQTQPQINVGVAVTPGFVGNLQNNLYFTAEASAAFSGDKDFNNAPFTTNFKKNSYRFTLGAEYRFAKEKKIQPFVGIGIGAATESYDGFYNGDRIDQAEGNIFFQPKAGVLVGLNNGKKIGFTVSFIPEYETNLSFIKNNTLIPLIVDSHYFNAGINYYF